MSGRYGPLGRHTDNDDAGVQHRRWKNGKESKGGTPTYLQVYICTYHRSLSSKVLRKSADNSKKFAFVLCQVFWAIIWSWPIATEDFGLIKILGWPKKFVSISISSCGKSGMNFLALIITPHGNTEKWGSDVIPASPMPDMPFHWMLPCARCILGICGICYMSRYTHSTSKQIFSFSPLKILRSHHPFSSFKMKPLCSGFFYIPSYRFVPGYEINRAGQP